MLNYRCLQLLSLIHSTELRAFVTALDPRLTYLNRSRLAVFDPTSYLPTFTYGDTERFTLLGDADLPDLDGRMWHEYRLLVEDGTTLLIDTLAPQQAQVAVTYTLTNGLTAPLDLPGSGYQFMLSNPLASQGWQLGYNARPQWDLGQILAGFDSIGEPVLLGLFGASPTEPLLTFKNLFYGHKELPYRLGALVLALGWQTDAVRRGEGT